MQIGLNLSLTGKEAYPTGFPISRLPYFAVSSRKLFYSSNRNIARIRREGDSAIQDFELKNPGMDASEIEAFINAGGPPTNGYFNRWHDQVNSVNILTQNAVDKQPLYVSNAINNKIGFESVIPSASVKWLINNRSLNYSTAATFFCVVDILGAQGTSGASPFATHELSAADMFKPYFSLGNYWLSGRDSLNNLFSSPSALNPSGRAIFVVTCDGVSNLKCWRNGNLDINYNVPNGFINTMRKIVAGSFYGYFSELLIFDTELSSEDRLTIQADQNAYFNVY